MSTTNLESDQLVLKRGRTTGLTVGKLNEINTTVTTSHYGDTIKFTAWHIAPEMTERISAN
jgi:hypothetical protein